MKALLLSALMVSSLTAAAQVTLYQEDFESYNAGDSIALLDPMHWRTWSGAPTGPEDAQISTANAGSGYNSLGIIAAGLDGGPTDLMLKLGDHTSGFYHVDLYMYVPSGSMAYFNIQHTEAHPPALVSAEVRLDENEDVMINTNGTYEVMGTYPHDSWFTVHMEVNENANGNTTLYCGSGTRTWPSNTSDNDATLANGLGAVAFYAYSDGTNPGEFYIDDVAFLDYSSTTSVSEFHSTASAMCFPDPMTDELFVRLGKTPAEVSLFDATGRMVLPAVIVQNERERLDVTGLESGSYFVRVRSGDEMEVLPVVKR